MLSYLLILFQMELILNFSYFKQAIEGVISMYTAEIMKSISVGDSEVREVIKNSRSIDLSALIDAYEHFYKSDGISICIYDLSNQQRKLIYQDGV